MSLTNTKILCNSAEEFNLIYKYMSYKVKPFSNISLERLNSSTKPVGLFLDNSSKLTYSTNVPTYEDDSYREITIQQLLDRNYPCYIAVESEAEFTEMKDLIRELPKLDNQLFVGHGYRHAGGANTIKGIALNNAIADYTSCAVRTNRRFNGLNPDTIHLTLEDLKLIQTLTSKTIISKPINLNQEFQIIINDETNFDQTQTALLNNGYKWGASGSRSISYVGHRYINVENNFLSLSNSVNWEVSQCTVPEIISLLKPAPNNINYLCDLGIAVKVTTEEEIREVVTQLSYYQTGSNYNLEDNYGNLSSYFNRINSTPMLISLSTSYENGIIPGACRHIPAHTKDSTVIESLSELHELDAEDFSQVVISSWESMEAVYGLDRNGCIDTDPCFTASMENVLPVNRTITIKSYVWKTNNSKHSYYISYDMVEKTINTGAKMKITIEELGTSSNQQPAKPAPVELSPVPEKAKWKNPEPNVPNPYDVSSYTYVVVDGETIPQSQTEHNTGEQYPIFKLDKSARVKVKDIILCNASHTWSVINNRKDLAEYKADADNYTVYRVLTEASSKDVVHNLTQYSCGKYKCSSSGDILDDISHLHKTNISPVDYSYNYQLISDEFSTPVEKLSPKDKEVFDELLVTLDHELNIEAREWALLTGPSGSGKTTIAIDYAKHHNKELVIQQGTIQLTVDDLLGYKSITTGEYISSLHRDAVEHGKVFILDEIDACNPNTILVLNALKKDQFQFPDALVDVHPNFRLIGTANTTGNEYSEKFNARQPMDAATLKRFHTINYDLTHAQLAIRYGLEYVKGIDLTNMDPRDVERHVRQTKIKQG